eukprot:4297764-Pyramimonas_sp.AAC.1
MQSYVIIYPMKRLLLWMARIMLLMALHCSEEVYYIDTADDDRGIGCSVTRCVCTQVAFVLIVTSSLRNLDMFVLGSTRT